MKLQFNINRNYKIIEKVSSENAIAKFYVAIDEQLNRTVGIKEFPIKNFNYDSVLKEIKANINIRQATPFIPEIYEVYRNKESIYIVFQYISKNDLRHLMKDNGLSEKEAIKIIKKIVNILDSIAVKFNGINHRDLKPENILVDANNNFYLIDYGLTVIPATFGEGTKNYRAPEQMDLGVRQIQMSNYQKVDQFALGIIFAELILGYVPIKGIHYQTSLTKKKETWAIVEELKKKKVSNKVISIILKLMSPEAKDRYRNLKELKHLL